MPKRSTSGFNPTGLNLDGHFYSAEDVGRIIEAVGRLPDTNVQHERPNEDSSGYITASVGRREALAERLESAAHGWHVASQYQTEPTAKQQADAFGKIWKAAEDLRKALGLPVKPKFRDEIADMPPALRFGGLQAYAAFMDVENSHEKWLWSGDARLREAVRGVYQIRNRARAARKRNMAKGPTPRNERNLGEIALDELFRSFADILKDIFERDIGISVGPPGSAKAGQPTGPSVHFLQACLKPLLNDDTPTKGAIRERCRRVFKGRHKPDSK